MSAGSVATAAVRGLAPYVIGKPIAELARELAMDERDIVKLASNENPLGPSPKALAAMQEALQDAWLYPDGNGHDLKAAIALSEGLEFGIVGINEWAAHATEAPFGGWKQSGLGHESGAEGLSEYLETKLVSVGGLA